MSSFINNNDTGSGNDPPQPKSQITNIEFYSNSDVTPNPNVNIVLPEVQCVKPFSKKKKVPVKQFNLFSNKQHVKQVIHIIKKSCCLIEKHI